MCIRGRPSLITSSSVITFIKPVISIYSLANILFVTPTVPSPPHVFVYYYYMRSIRRPSALALTAIEAAIKPLIAGHCSVERRNKE